MIPDGHLLFFFFALAFAVPARIAGLIIGERWPLLFVVASVGLLIAAAVGTGFERWVTFVFFTPVLVFIVTGAFPAVRTYRLQRRAAAQPEDPVS